MIRRGALVLVVALLGGTAHAQPTCEGRLERTPEVFEVGGCNLIGRNAYNVAAVCSTGQQCVVTGSTKACPASAARAS